MFDAENDYFAEIFTDPVQDAVGPPAGNQSGPLLICGVSVLASAL